MTAPTEPRLKITYATLRNDNETLHAQFEAGLALARRELLGGYHRNVVGRPRTRRRRHVREAHAHRPARSWAPSPRAPGRTSGTRSPPRARAFPAWSRRPWQERVAILRRAADLISERQMEFAALLAIEVGKNRLEALGDVEETADLIR